MNELQGGEKRLLNVFEGLELLLCAVHAEFCGYGFRLEGVGCGGEGVVGPADPDRAEILGDLCDDRLCGFHFGMQADLELLEGVEQGGGVESF